MPDLAMPLPPMVSRVTAMKRGMLGRCPACGQGRLFGKFLKVNESCSHCGTEFHHHRADDMPPYIVMFIVGHVIGYCVLMSETRFDIPLAVQIAVWPAATLALCLGLLQPVKGAVVGLQYALGMHGFGSAAALAHKSRAENGYASGANDLPRDNGPA
ncbi:DUF983 domain-containing protein [Microvirga antarctica]|uniref:DUF983 domain-containing protein n=1 Tax=Microvirga antarctica TaxID=2819233 RepID=UPI001FEA1611|nr:DUF983 domain-containing protein [Microvirga antarctica]